MQEAEPHYTSGGNKKIMWLCDCKCGNRVIVPSGALLNGSTKSCGCFSKENTKIRMQECQKKTNYYDLSGDFGIGYTSNNEFFYFDTEDYDKIKDFCWFFHHKYLCAKLPGSGRHIYFHKVVMRDEENWFDVDHIITENKFDNRKRNLRLATRSQNNRNKIMQKNNSSGVVGVCWHKRGCRWRAQIGIHGKTIYLGSFTFIQDAIKARKDAEEKYFGNWSYSNSQKLKQEVFNGI